MGTAWLFGRLKLAIHEPAKRAPAVGLDADQQARGIRGGFVVREGLCFEVCGNSAPPLRSID
jgi:hypothetical protein